MITFEIGKLESIPKEFFNSEATMEIINQGEEEHKGREKHVVFLVLQKFNSPKRNTRIDINSENGAIHKDNEVHSMIYRNEENCLQFSLPVWLSFYLPEIF